MSVLHSCVTRSFFLYPRLVIFLGIKIYFLGMKKKMDMLHLSSECGALWSHADSADFHRDMRSKILWFSVISVCNDF